MCINSSIILHHYSEINKKNYYNPLLHKNDSFFMSISNVNIHKNNFFNIYTKTAYYSFNHISTTYKKCNKTIFTSNTFRGPPSCFPLRQLHPDPPHSPHVPSLRRRSPSDLQLRFRQRPLRVLRHCSCDSGAEARPIAAAGGSAAPNRGPTPKTPKGATGERNCDGGRSRSGAGGSWWCEGGSCLCFCLLSELAWGRKLIIIILV